MYILMIVVFVLGYMAIALEHPIKVDKAASALLTGVLCWVAYVFGSESILGLDYGKSIIENLDPDVPFVKGLKAFIDTYIPRPGDTMHIIASHYIVHDLMHHLGEIASIRECASSTSIET